MDEDRLLLSEIVKRLDVLIKLTLENRPDFPKPKPERPQIAMLFRLGLRPSEIGKIMGIKTTTITAHLSQLKKQKKGASKA